jgi:hypothetical protein
LHFHLHQPVSGLESLGSGTHKSFGDSQHYYRRMRYLQWKFVPTGLLCTTRATKP